MKNSSYCSLHLHLTEPNTKPDKLFIYKVVYHAKRRAWNTSGLPDTVRASHHKIARFMVKACTKERFSLYHA
jgi:hypothetical protein